MATIVGTFTNPLKNGTTEDATQVMNLFSFIQSQVNSNACPSTAGQAILKGDGSGGTSTAVAGTDYCAATSGSAILKGNGSGGTTAAAAGTDYFVPGATFSAYQSAAQSLTANVFAKIAIQTKEWDNAGAFDATTNFRFQPNVAGFYLVTGALSVAATQTGVIASVYKNGSEIKRGTQVSSSSNSNVSALVQLNGTTDYVELWGQSGVTQNTAAGVALTYMQAVQVR